MKRKILYRCHWCRSVINEAQDPHPYEMPFPGGGIQFIRFHSICLPHWNKVAVTKEFADVWARQYSRKGDSGAVPS
jgi:hypothetical protein